MAIIKCKMCGGDLNISEGMSVAECEYCGTRQTVPNVDNEKKVTLFSRANRLRLACEFDKAASVYENIVSEFPEEAEAYWGLVLCRYGIEYVDDPATGKKMPTCHRSSFESIRDDSDFEQACENADAVARKVYREEAKAIEEIRKSILEVSGKEPPYDIFICYKETDEAGNRTIDSVLAQDVYDALTEKSYRVFFSRITLEDKLGTEYEPYIFAALNSAKVMLAFGTDYEYFNAVWVKNEWSRFLKLMAQDKTKHLIPCYKDVDAYDLPKEFQKLQAQDLGKVGAVQDLLRGIDKLLGMGGIATSQSTGGPTADTLLQRAQLFLEDKDWNEANNYFDKVLDLNPQCAEAYVGKVCAENKYTDIAQMAGDESVDTESSNLKKAIRFANPALRAQLEEYRDAAARAQAELARQKQEEEEAYRQRQAEKIPELTRRRELIRPAAGLIAVGYQTTIGLKADGTVLSTDKQYAWDRVVEISAAPGGAAARTEAGTVLCDRIGDIDQDGTRQWYDIVALTGDDFHLVGLKSDGTVVAAGRNEYGECEVQDWTDVVAISSNDENTVGLKSDGTVVATGENAFGECNVGHMSGIQRIVVQGTHTVGLRADGTIQISRANSDGHGMEKHVPEEDWTDIVDVVCCSTHVVGLRVDGTVLVEGDTLKPLRRWEDIVALSASNNHVVGLKLDGTVLAYGENDHGQCNVKSWKQIVAVFAGDGCTIGIQEDGTVVATRYTGDPDESGQCQVKGWRLFDCMETLVEKEKRLQEEAPQIYENAVARVTNLPMEFGSIDELSFATNEIQKSIGDFVQLGDYQDSKAQIAACEETLSRLAQRAEQIKQCLEKEKQRRKEEEERRRKEERARRKAQLEQERDSFKTELANLKGLFTGKRRKEIEARLAEIERELKKM